MQNIGYGRQFEDIKQHTESQSAGIINRCINRRKSYEIGWIVNDKSKFSELPIAFLDSA